MSDDFKNLDDIDFIAQINPKSFLGANPYRKAQSVPKVTFTKKSVFNEDGELVFESSSVNYSKNKGGFVISYTEKMCEFISKCSTGSIVRVFLYIAHHQNYGTDGKTFGYRCSHKYLQQVLHIDKSTLWDALKYLKDNFLVNVMTIEGYTEFMVNPAYVTIGSDKKTRMKEWSRRWAEYWVKQNAKRVPASDRKEDEVARQADEVFGKVGDIQF